MKSFESLYRAARGIAHGLAWKAAAIAARFAFLLLIVPHMRLGQYGTYFTLSSASLVAARICASGSVDHLPAVVRADLDEMTRFTRAALPFFWLSCVATAASLLFGSIFLACSGLVVSLTTGFVLAGATRSIRPAWFEQFTNAQPIVLTLLALVSGDGIDAVRVLALQSAASVVAQARLLWPQAASLSAQASSHDSSVSSIIWSRRAWSIMLSDVLAIASVRGLVIGPWLLGRGTVSDSLALAVAIGEASWTSGLVVVNRNFSVYCRAGVSKRRFATTVCAVSVAVVLLAGLAIVGAQSGILYAIVPKSLLQLTLLLPAMLFFGAVLILGEVKYVDIAMGASMRPWLTGQTVFSSFSLLLIPLIGELASLWSLALAAMVLAGVCVGVRMSCTSPDPI